MTRSIRNTAVNLLAPMVAACLMVGYLPAVASATPLSIGVNFEGGGNAAPSMSPTPPTSVSGTAGIVPQTNWNNFPTSSGTLALINSNNNPTTASVTVTNANGTYAATASNNPTPLGGDQQLNEGFLYSNGVTTAITTTITGIPYASYNLYIYELNDASGRVDQTTLGSTTYYGSAPNPTDADHVSGVANTYLYTQATSTSLSSPTSGADYVLFTGLSGSSQSFTVEAANNGYLSGFQIVQVTPEPSSFVLGGLGAAGLLWAARRRRRA